MPKALFSGQYAPCLAVPGQWGRRPSWFATINVFLFALDRRRNEESGMGSSLR